MAHSGDGAATITCGWTNDYGSDFWVQWTWTGDGTTLSTTIDLSLLLPKRINWYLYMVKEVHGAGAADPSDHAVTLTDSDGASILITNNFEETGFKDAAEDMPNYWRWDGNNIVASTTNIGSADTATVRLLFCK